MPYAYNHGLLNTLRGEQSEETVLYAYADTPTALICLIRQLNDYKEINSMY